ncbi:MAG: hypothetical protein QMC80_08705 [Thermoplasmatales archaeon]|nr:hypothetical protein [Thermoplasmatales archaeon]
MKNKNRFGNIALKSFIAVAVVIMLLSVLPSQAEIHEKNRYKLMGILLYYQKYYNYNIPL